MFNNRAHIGLHLHVVAHLVEQSPPIPEVRGSMSPTGKNIFRYFQRNKNNEKYQIKTYNVIVLVGSRQTFDDIYQTKQKSFISGDQFLNFFFNFGQHQPIFQFCFPLSLHCLQFNEKFERKTIKYVNHEKYYLMCLEFKPSNCLQLSLSKLRCKFF